MTGKTHKEMEYLVSHTDSDDLNHTSEWYLYRGESVDAAVGKYIEDTGCGIDVTFWVLPAPAPSILEYEFGVRPKRVKG